LALAALASQPLKSGTLSLYLSVPVPVLTPSVITSRPTTASRPSNPLNPSALAPQIRLCWPLRAFINIFTYLLTYINHRVGQKSKLLIFSEYVNMLIFINIVFITFSRRVVDIVQCPWSNFCLFTTLYYWLFYITLHYNERIHSF